MTDHWLCALGDALFDPDYFHPPLPPTGGPILRVTAFHRTYPEGRLFERAAGGALWTRVG